MKKTITSLAALLLTTVTALAQTGSWKAHMSYYEPQQIVKAGQQLFVRASNDLYSYNLNDHSIRTYDKVTALSDSYINHIAWNKDTQRLIIIYKNQNIDLMDADGNVVNLSSLYAKSIMGDKTVNNIYMYGPYAYLATGFGIVKVNMARTEIAESYILSASITAVGVSDGTIYARKADGSVLSSLLTKNLIDPHNWVATTDGVPAGLFDQDLSDWNDYIETVRTLKPGGPKNNFFTFLRYKNHTLYSCPTGYESSIELNRPGTILVYDGNEWSHLQDEGIKGVFPGTESSSWQYVDMQEVDVDPQDSKRIIGGSRTGLYEFYDGQLKNYYNKDNSLLKPATSSNRYVLCRSVFFDKQGTLWVLQSNVVGQSLIRIDRDGTWNVLDLPEVLIGEKSKQYLQGLYEDSRGYIWFVSAMWEGRRIFCYDPATNKIITYFDNLVNQDGITTSDYTPIMVTEDMEGNIWVATNMGPFVIEKDQIGQTNPHVTQVKVPRNDGSNYADYLFAGTVVRSIVVDGGGRKWIGTQGSGVYLISADNMTQLEHFTAENSPLLSNNIESMVIDNESGELFIGTESGLCTYMTDATAAESDMTADNIYAFPNPVTKDYSGVITVRGLSIDADVKILSVSGKLIAQGRSNGGTFTWDGRDSSGRRVASGVYMVATATKDGKKGTVCKIAVVN